jgi:hypothetical protein
VPRPRLTDRDCARALWLLGLEPPVTERELRSAFKARLLRSHPDLHAGSDTRTRAATVLTRALNDARTVVAGWIESGRPWPRPGLTGEIDDWDEPPLAYDDDGGEPAAAPAEPAPVCRHTGLRAGDRVRVWPYDEDVEDRLDVVAGTEHDPSSHTTWVQLSGGGGTRADRIRLAAFSCPVCGMCEGPRVAEPTIRPCPACLVDLRLLETRPGEARRIRSAIEARSQAGAAIARGLADGSMYDRARDRNRWARRLAEAGPDDVRSALLSAFTNAYDRWGGWMPPDAERRQRA